MSRCNAFSDEPGKGGFVRLDPVPEPAVCALMVMTVGALGRRRVGRVGLP